LVDRIIIKSKDELSAIVERVIGAGSEEVILVVPKISEFGSSFLNFRLLKRESESSDKKVVIESESESVRKMAVEAGFQIVPARGVSSVIRRSFSDILPPRVSGDTGIDQRLRAVGKDSAKEYLEETATPPVAGKKLSRYKREKGGGLQESFPNIETPQGAVAAAIEPSKGEDVVAEALPPESKPNLGFRAMKVLTAAAIVLFAGAGGFLAVTRLPRAAIEIDVKEIRFDFKDAITAEVGRTELATNPPAIGLQALSFSKSSDPRDFPASGRQEIQRKAKGQIIIYNSFSSDSQTLVATTRFLTSDGKLFRLDKAIQIPGAKIQDGKIIPSSIAAAVTADRTGPEYNIGPVSRFSIPGFQGTPKYQSFYAESKEPMAGGFIGEAHVVTKQDLDSAKAEISLALQESSEKEFELKLPEGFVLIDGAKESTFDTLTFSHNAGDAAETFTAVGKFVLRAAVFKESEVKQLMHALAEEGVGAKLVLREDALTYGVARVDFKANKASFPVNYQATLYRYIDIDELRTKLVGKKEIALKEIIFALPGLEKAKISLWPFWVRSAPKDTSRIKITLQ